MSEQYNIRLNYNYPQPSTVTYERPAGTAVNLTGYTAACKIVSLDDTDLGITTLTTANGGLTLGGVLGTITVNWHTFIASIPEVGSWKLVVINGSGGNDFVTSGTVVVEDKP
jgi:hypothetical protein